MGRKEEEAALRAKIKQSRPGIEENIGGQCIEKGLELYDQNQGGLLYWIGSLLNIGLKWGLHHTYYIPPDAQDGDLAQNQADNGFSQYPSLTVGEVKKLGTPQNLNVARELSQRGRRNRS